MNRINKKHFTLLIGTLLLVAVVLFYQVQTRVAAKQNISNPVTTGNSHSVIVAGAVPSGQITVPILMYHHVGGLLNSDAVTSDLTVSVADFQAQVEYFHALGYHTVTLEQVYQALENNQPLSARSLVFTFDDGYMDVFTNAIPILKANGFSGTFAIATELLGRPTYANWSDVIAAQDQGMEIVSHTENHLDLTSKKYSIDDLSREIYGSKNILEQKLGHPIDFFVYPYGHHNAIVEQMVKDAGYKMAFTTDFGMGMASAKLLSAPRVRVHGQGGLDKLKQIFSGAWRSARASQDH